MMIDAISRASAAADSIREDACAKPAAKEALPLPEALSSLRFHMGGNRRHRKNKAVSFPRNSENL